MSGTSDPVLTLRPTIPAFRGGKERTDYHTDYPIVSDLNDRVADAVNPKEIAPLVPAPSNSRPAVLRGKDRVAHSDIENRVAAAAKDEVAPDLDDEKEMSVVPVVVNGGRAVKDGVSKNCLGLLKRILGEMSTTLTSADLRKLPKGEAAWNHYSAEIHDLRRDGGFKKGYGALRGKVEEIQRLINNPPIELEKQSEYRKMVQELICETLKDPIYQQIKKHELDPLVHFLHTASDIIHNNSEGMSVFEGLGARLLPDLPAGLHDYKALERGLDGARTGSTVYSADNLFKRIPHAVTHWNRTIATWDSKSAKSLDTYNAYALGNYNAELGTYVIDGVSIRTSAGPNPSHDDYQIFSAVNQRNENLRPILDLPPGAGPSHTQAILEGAENEDEGDGGKGRRNKVLNLVQNHPDQYTAMALPLDGPAWKGEGPFKNVETTMGFASELDKLMGAPGGYRERPLDLNHDNGFVIPEKLLSNRKVEEVNGAFISAFSCLEENNPAWEKLAKSNKLSKTLLLGYDAVVGLKGLVAVAEKQKQVPEHLRNPTIDGLKILSTFNFACKQGIDRGVILNMLLRMIVDARANGGEFTITDKQLRQYSGYTAGRASTVEDRKIQKKRYEALKNFAKIITSASPAQQKAFIDCLALPEDMHFVPSNG